MEAYLTKEEWKAAYRWYRIASRMQDELIHDQLIYGTAFRIINAYGIFNIPPWEIYDGNWSPI